MTKKDTSYPQLSAVDHRGPYQMPAFRPPVVNPKTKGTQQKQRHFQS